MAKRNLVAVNVKENIDPDEVDFCKPKPKKGKVGDPVNQFATPLSEATIPEYGKGPVVSNTMKNTQWAVRDFSQWYQERNKTEGEKCPENLLENKSSAELLNKWLSRFVLEARRGDGTPYPSSSIYQLLHVRPTATCSWPLEGLSQLHGQTKFCFC